MHWFHDEGFIPICSFQMIKELINRTETHENIADMVPFFDDLLEPDFLPVVPAGQFIGPLVIEVDTVFI